MFATLLASVVFITIVGLVPGGGLPFMLTAALAASVFIATLCVAYMLACILLSVPLGLLLTIAMICLIGIDRSYVSVIMSALVCIAGMSYAVVKLRIPRREILQCMVAAGAVAAYSLGTYQYTSFDMMALAHSGLIHNDTIFHASVSAMIKNYGTLSTGLHGLVEMPYHVLSHAAVAGFSRISGISILEIYGFITQILLIPIFVISMSYVSRALEKEKDHSVIYSVFITIVLLIAANLIFYRWAFWDSYTLSESFTLSLIILVIGLPSLFKRDIGAKDILIAVLVAYGTAQAKGSVGLVYLAAWSARLVLTGGWRRKHDLAAFAIVVLAFLLAAGRTAQDQSSAEIVPFEFVRIFSFYGGSISNVMQVWAGGGWPGPGPLLFAALAMGSFLACHFFFVWVIVLHRCWRDGLDAAVISPQVACLLGATGFGLLIAAIFSFPGGAVYYFTAVAGIMALPAVVAIVYDGSRWANQRLFGSRVAARSIAVASCLVLVAMNGTVGYEKLATRLSSSAVPQNEFVSGLRKLRSEALLDRVFRASPSAVRLNPQKLCWTRPFNFPALSERVWTDVIPPDPDCTYLYYGYAFYGVGTEEQSVKVPIDLGNGLVLEVWPGPESR